MIGYLHKLFVIGMPSSQTEFMKQWSRNEKNLKHVDVNSRWNSSRGREFRFRNKYNGVH